MLLFTGFLAGKASSGRLQPAHPAGGESSGMTTFLSCLIFFWAANVVSAGIKSRLSIRWWKA
jgi:hypothetical protein